MYHPTLSIDWRVTRRIHLFVSLYVIYCTTTTPSDKYCNFGTSSASISCYHMDVIVSFLEIAFCPILGRTALRVDQTR